jgi:hypothetical protein
MNHAEHVDVQYWQVIACKVPAALSEDQLRLCCACRNPGRCTVAEGAIAAAYLHLLQV